MKRGRPFSSIIRQNLIEILNLAGKAYGYQLHKIYIELFPPVTREVVYYNLKIGVRLGEFEIAEIKQEKGDYSWGGKEKKIYYPLGPKEIQKEEERERNFFRPK